MKLPIVSWKDVEQVLGKLGYVFDRQRGSHRIYVRAQPSDTISVPQHREIAKGTPKSILRQLGLSVEDFVALVRDC
jgi:predicted RNA binding protein YcfA (HicA-like mRNA interferase family)